MTKLLFICTLNLQRSPTAENLFRNSEEYTVNSAGIDQNASLLVSQDLIDWADTIFVMEPIHEKFIKLHFDAQDADIRVLDIPDTYIREDPELKMILEEKLLKEGINLDS